MTGGGLTNRPRFTPKSVLRFMLGDWHENLGSTTMIRTSITLIPIAALLALASPATPVAAGEQTMVKVGVPLQRMDLLRPGVHRYLRYKVEGDRRELIDIWTRRISFETFEGKKALHISQRWDEVGEPLTVLEQDSWFEAGTFRPLTHKRRLTKGEEITMKFYRFLPDAIVGVPEMEGNLAKDYKVASNEPMFNFETDMELLQALPLAEGYEANLPFADAGITDPNRYVFKVAGSAVIPGPDGRPVDCWLITADYNKGKIRARFWFDKRSQVMLHEESPLDEGGMLVKTLVGAESTDL